MDRADDQRWVEPVTSRSSRAHLQRDAPQKRPSPNNPYDRFDAANAGADHSEADDDENDDELSDMSPEPRARQQRRAIVLQPQQQPRQVHERRTAPMAKRCKKDASTAATSVTCEELTAMFGISLCEVGWPPLSQQRA